MLDKNVFDLDAEDLDALKEQMGEKAVALTRVLEKGIITNKDFAMKIFLDSFPRPESIEH